jgi:galactose oxidase-like protein/carboxypeptidase family protein/flagellar hook capping protein FlgD
VRTAAASTAVVCAFTAVASAATVSGVVRDGGALPLAGARVTLASPDTSQFFETRSASDGSYEFSGAAAGTWQIGASRLGRAYAETFRVIGVSDVVQDFSLGPDVHPGRWSVIGNTDPENLYATDSGSLLPDGRIFYCHDTIDPVIFNPLNGSKSFPPASPSQQGCHITTLLEDGRLVFIGGQDSGDFRDAVRTVKTYDHILNSWTVLPSLIEERWYPGLARLADGKLLAMGGGQRPNAQRTPTCEIFDPESPAWTATGSMSNPSDYPPAVLLYNGNVLRSWWPPQLFDTGSGLWTTTGSMVQTNRFWPGHCDHSLVVLPDGRAGAVGIYRGSLSSPSMVELYDPNTGSWSLGANATVTRSQPEVVMLPTGQVFVAGGKLEDPNPSVSTNAWGQTRLTDLYDPVADTWRTCADMAWHREYHAVTVLVPDGRVLTTAGTGGPAQPGISNAVEAFEPPYLFRGVRPRVDAISSTSFQNGNTFQVDVSRTDSATAVVLVGTNAVTHWVDGGVPRVLSLPFQQAGSVLQVMVPPNQNLAPVGYYILFVMVDDIPSAGQIVRIVNGGTADTPGSIPWEARLRAWPNPFRAQARIAWYQARAGNVGLDIFDLSGRLVHSHEASEGAGWRQFDWDGRSARGDALPAGLYWLRLQTGDRVDVVKLVRVAE